MASYLYLLLNWKSLKLAYRVKDDTKGQLHNPGLLCFLCFHLFADIELLESRVKELEENEEKKKTEICDLRKQLQAVREEINSMERIHFRGDDLGSRIDLCPDNASLNESPKTEKTVSTPMVQTEKNKDDGRKGVHKKIKNVNAEKRRQKTDEENKPSIKDLTRQKPEIIDNSPIEMNLPKLDTPQ